VLKRVPARAAPADRVREGTVGGRFAIVASRYNAEFVDGLLRAAEAELRATGVRDVEVVRVPGAFEIPAVAARLARRPAGRGRPVAIICLGVIFQGQTSHAEHIGWGVTEALVRLQVEHALPIVHGVFVFKKVEHARVRCLGRKHNRGREAAQTALEMARLMAALRKG
jgi:6,7-dimethyl-8-ribityllumazine synthase